MGADNGHLGGLVGAYRGIELIGEMGQTEAPTALVAVEFVGEFAALEAAQAIVVAKADAAHVVLVARDIVVLGGAVRTGADGVVAFEDVGVLLAEGASAILAGLTGRVGTAPDAPSQHAATRGHELTVPGCATACQQEGEGWFTARTGWAIVHRAKQWR